MLYHILYLSSEAVPFSKADLGDLLKNARERNSKMNITGVLFYKDGSFLQAIEGEKEDVEKLYKSIQEDSRHFQLIKLFAEEIDQREYPDWTMGYRDIDTLPDDFPEGFDDLLNLKWTDKNLLGHSGKVRAFMQIFSHG